MRSNLNVLIATREQAEGRRIPQKEIVKATGLDANTVSRWMSPEPFTRFDTKPIIALCRYLNCGVGDLLYIDRETETA